MSGHRDLRRDELPPFQLGRSRSAETPDTIRAAFGPAGRGQGAVRPKVTDAIVEAVFNELAEKGFLGMSMDGVARRAGVGKSALYRRWPSKIEMTTSVLGVLSRVDRPAVDTGALETDIRALLDDVLAWLSSPHLRRIYSDLLGEAQRNPTLAEALKEYVGQPRRRRAQAVLDRAQARGELAEDADQDIIVDAMGAFIFWRLIALHRPVTASCLDAIAALVLTLAQGSTASTAPTHDSGA